MSDVGSWQPDQVTTLSDEVIATLNKAAAGLSEQELGIEQGERAALQGIMALDPELWRTRAVQASDADVIGWIKVLTLLEERFPGFEAGAKSPVIPLVACLRERAAYPDDLTAWIKAHTSNRFLPYGSLLDRL